jgi:TRAP-type uncharacterized transport system substrate-binding protein
MNPHRWGLRAAWKWAAPAVAVAALGVAAYFYFHAPQSRRHHLTMTAGPTVSTRHHLAELLRAEAAPKGIDLELRGTVGSEESLDQVNSRELDCALVQGGLSIGDRPNIRQVAVLPVEPLHLLVKKDLVAGVSARLAALEGKTIDIGEAGTGTRTLAVAVLTFAGMAPQADGQGGYVPREMSWAEMTATPTADMPDAIFIVSCLPSRRVKFLVAHHRYQLVPLPFGEAFAMESLAQDRTHAPAEHVIDKGRTHPAVIPAFTYGVEPPVPPAPLPTLGNRLLLVAHKDVDPRVVKRLIEVLFASEVARRVRPPVDAGHMDLPPEMSWHDGAEQYRRDNRPLVPGDLMELAQKSAAVFAGVASGVVVLVGWMLARRKAPKARQFRKVLHEVSRVDEETMRREDGGNASAAELVALRARLLQLRAAALDRYADGELDDDQLMSCFLLHVNSSRDNLTRLIAEFRHAPAVGGHPLRAAPPDGNPTPTLAAPPGRIIDQPEA